MAASFGQSTPCEKEQIESVQSIGNRTNREDKNGNDRNQIRVLWHGNNCSVNCAIKYPLSPKTVFNVLEIYFWIGYLIDILT